MKNKTSNLKRWGLMGCVSYFSSFPVSTLCFFMIVFLCVWNETMICHVYCGTVVACGSQNLHAFATSSYHFFLSLSLSKNSKKGFKPFIYQTGTPLSLFFIFLLGIFNYFFYNIKGYKIQHNSTMEFVALVDRCWIF